MLVAPAPVEPAPVEPAPVEPAPVEPAPVELDPTTGLLTPQSGLLWEPRHYGLRPRPGPSLRRGPSTRLVSTWLAAFAVLFLAAAAWSFASPLGSGPDEPAHLDRAASLVRGQWLGTPLPHPTNFQKSTVTVRVPEVFAALANDIGCFQFKSQVPAGCRPALPASAKEVSTQTYVGRYPPLYYLLVGLPTLFLVSVKGIYGARLVSCALSAAMLALAITSLRRCRGTPLLAAGAAVAVTPMVIYLAGVINPNGLEVASAVSAWVSAMALASQPLEELSASTIGSLGASLMVLVLARPLSPIWALAVVAALVIVERRWSWRELFGLSTARAWAGGFIAALVAAAAWDLYANPFLTEPGTPLPAHTSESGIVVMAIERLDLLVNSSIGFFGWLDAPSPEAVIVAWLFVLGFLVLVGAALGRLRGVAAMCGTLAAWVVLPVAVAVVQARTEGILGQGRDYLGLAVGIPILAAAIAGERFANRDGSLRLVSIVVAVLAVAQLADFYGTLRRYMVGTKGPLNAFVHVAGGWGPPVPGILLLVLFALFMAAFAGILRSAALAQPAGAWEAAE